MVSPDARRHLVVIAQPDMVAVDDFVELFDGDDLVTVDVIQTESPEEVDAAISDAVARGADSVASVGGDGSINIVASALVRAGSDLALAPVPAGTVNLATQVLGLPDAAATADAVRAGRSRVIDVGETDHGVFVLNASTGFDAAVIDDAADHSEARFGRLSFAVAGVRRLRRQSSEQVRVDVGGTTVFEGRATSVVVMNSGQRASDSVFLAPDARPDDGMLDVVVIRAETVRAMAKLVWRVVRGAEISTREIVRGQGARVHVKWATEVASQRDGDADDPIRSLTATCRPRALRVHHG